MSRGRQLGRIRLRPLSLELRQRYLLDWDPRQLAKSQRSFPQLDSASLFSNSQPLEVEIGAGSGEFLAALAAADPAHNFLAIEISRRAVHKAVLEAAERDLTNLLVLRADFKLLASLLPQAGWQHAYLHFPDPPHNREDEKRVIFDARFLDQMATTLEPDGTLSVVSDHEAFFARMLQLAESDPRFAKTHAEPYLDGFEPVVKSRFQKVWERKGRRPRQFVLRRL
jgi:tRNA (guanine-N7-)-methyltransferase